jgi:prepilin-type N-terminal cleavage/methylation domain-containing protein
VIATPTPPIRARSRHAMTLLEVLVTLVLLGLVTSVATLATQPIQRRPNDLRSMLDDSLSAAIAQGRRITISARARERAITATVNPDGSIVADSEFHVNARDDSDEARP